MVTFDRWSNVTKKDTMEHIATKETVARKRPKDPTDDQLSEIFQHQIISMDDFIVVFAAETGFYL